MKETCNSIYDLAKLCGVSYATVSRVLNGNGRSSPETRRKVLEMASKTNFRPKMKTRKTTVALMIDASAPRQDYIPCVMARLVELLSCHGLAIEIYTKSNLSQFRECYADAVVAMPWSESVCELLASAKIPKITFNYRKLDGFSNVVSDHYQSGRMAAELLHSRGHSSAGVIVASDDHCNSRRVAGFKDFFQEKGLPLKPGLAGILRNGSPLALSGQMLAEGATGLFIGMDDSTVEFWSVFHALKLRIPEDLSVVAMENSVYSRHLVPPVSSVDQRLELMVEKTVELAVKAISSEAFEPEEITVENVLIERLSVAEPSKRTKEEER